MTDGYADTSTWPGKLFTPGAGEIPPCLAGREEQEKDLAAAVRILADQKVGHQTIAMFGPRGVGKTTLLNAFGAGFGDRVNIIRTSPHRTLRSISDIPGLLIKKPNLFKKKLPKSVRIGLPNILELGWDMTDSVQEGLVIDRIIKECRKKPKVLVVDEAHRLREETAPYLFDLVQELIPRAPFFMVLAGTPDLPAHIRRVRAAFMNRAKRVPLKPLPPDAAALALRVPFEKYGVAIDPPVLNEIVAAAHGYPHFIQLWGEELWRQVRENRIPIITAAEFAAVEKAVKDRREERYNDYYNEINKMPYIRPAREIARAFTEAESISRTDILKIVENTLPGSLSPDGREEAALSIIKHLESNDVLWSPKQGAYEPAVPSFHAHIMNMDAEGTER